MLKISSLTKPEQLKPGERGQIFVLFIIFSVLIFASAVGAIDLGTFTKARQNLEIAVDASALAGGLELPISGIEARIKVLEYIDINYPGVNHADVLTTFRCLVGDRNGDGNPDTVDIPATCDPGTGNPWTCDDGLCISWCEFTGSNRCNVLVVEATKDVPLIFTTLLGMSPIEITASRTGACNGPCGAPPTVPLDVALIIDRTPSMSSSDIANAKSAALTALEIFNPEFQHVALVVLGAGDPGDTCDDLDPTSGGNWLVVPLSDDYKNADGTLNTSSDLVSTIQCLQVSEIFQQTDLGSPISDSYYGQADALGELLGSTRDAPMGIILLTDGAARRPYSDWPDYPDFFPGPSPTGNNCAYANSRATFAKDEGIEIFTIGYGVSGDRCNHELGGSYYNVLTTVLLADMATNSADDKGHCSNSSNIAAENADGDHFLCEARGEDLDQVLATAAAALAGGIRLIGFPEGVVIP